MLNRKIKSFLKQKPFPPKREWVNVHNSMDVYLRLTLRHFNGKEFSCLDIASVEVKEDKRGQGLFTRFLAAIEEASPTEAIYVEQVMVNRFADFFRKRGWLEKRIAGIPSFYKIKESR